MKDIDAAYYGFRDDDDGILVPLEIEAEKAAIEAAVVSWKEKSEDMEFEGEDIPDIYAVPDMSEQDRLESVSKKKFIPS